MTTSPPVPKGLSPKSRGTWKTLTTSSPTSENRWQAQELVGLERALRWFNRADDWLVAAEGAQGREAQQLVKQSMDASNCGLRYWRTLKFSDAAAARRPGLRETAGHATSTTPWNCTSR